MPGEEHPPARIIFVDPRRTVTVKLARSRRARTTCCTWRSTPAPTLRLFNACFTYVADKGWDDKEFIDEHYDGEPPPLSAEAIR